MQLSTHFSLKEAIYSPTAERQGLDNSPPPNILESMKFTALKMEAVRQLLGNRAIYVTSWYRGPELNKLVRGATESQHTKGEAVDFICTGYGNIKQICKKLIDSKDVIQYDQLILEPSWVHISFVQNNPRGNELTYTGGGYQKGISV